MSNKREITPHAAAAKAIREELKAKFPDHKFSVRSSSFSMGNSVDVLCPASLDPDKVDEVQAIAGKYQAGHFDGMNDIYETSNRRDDLPQVKFVHVEVARD